jgi:hypothetical protein
MMVAYVLTMPNNSSWNGKWSGDGACYARVRTYRRDAPAEGSHYYNFGDGWGASVEVSHPDRSEAAQLRRRSKGFCGYEWMIDEIEKLGRIRTLDERSADSDICHLSDVQLQKKKEWAEKRCQHQWGRQLLHRVNAAILERKEPGND